MSILLVDSYDSFTYNLRDLLKESTNAHVHTIHNDSYKLPDDSIVLNKLIDSMDAIVIGPGPGSPCNSDDIGIIPYIYENFPGKPILGICLGFQTLCLSNGCEIDYLNEPIHGQIHNISISDSSSIFQNFPANFDSVRYHSIYVVEPPRNSNILPLAYYEPDNILMAAKHKTNPHFGVQYHPESICSTFGRQLIENFWSMVKTSKNINTDLIDSHLLNLKPLINEFKSEVKFDYQFQVLSVGRDILSLCESLPKDQDFLLLNSALTPGKWSIIGLPSNFESQVLSHSTELPNQLKLSTWSSENFEIESINDIYSYLARFMSNKFFQPEIPNDLLKSCPFNGGLIGYISYEEGKYVELENLNKVTKSEIDDLKLCFIERFIAVSEKSSFIVTIKPNDNEWLNSMKNYLENNQTKKVNKSIKSLLLTDEKIEITLPDKLDYSKNYNKCQDFLKNGDTYELCLTRPTLIKIPKKIEAWEIYKNLVNKNPSPYSSYLNFGSSKLLSTSPERFIYWDSKSCQMRPIKGTIKKTPEVDYEKACTLLKIPKEMGENLMIVDLIRHDLFMFLENVKVSKLMTVEEYKTIYQLVSVIDGDLSVSKFSGIDLLSYSLPPGSMTGAPKKRSVELLHNLETNERRGLYSGICGYWSINDTADWSVIIRSLFNYDDDLQSNEDVNCYRCGAGGAITVLSTCEGEWNEMLIKLDSVLQMFE